MDSLEPLFYTSLLMKPLRKFEARYLLLFILSAYIASCTWIRKEAVVISSHGTQYGERYYSARLVEKLKTVDGPSIKDPALLRTLKEALTEELIVEGALFAWGRAHRIHFSQNELTGKLRQLIGSDKNINTNVQESSPSMNLLRDALYVQLLQEKLQETLTASVLVDEVELKKFYEEKRKHFERNQAQFRQVVLLEEQNATTLLAHLLSKKMTFEDAEKKFSILRDFKSNPADIPFVDMSEPGFLSQLVHAPLGLQPRVFKSPAGFHLVNLIRVKKNATQPFDALRPQIEELYKRTRGEDLYLQWLRDQVKTDKVHVDQVKILGVTAEYQESF